MKKKIKSPKVVIVKRPKWLRGDNDSYLLNGDGKMCCLGFLAREAGFTAKQIRGIQEPDGLHKCIIGLADDNNDFTELYNTDIAEKLMVTNDDDYITDKTREKKIKVLGKKIGVTFKFEG